MMHVAVIGPGALGCLFAARLHGAGLPVTLVDYRADRAALLREQGLTVEESGKTWKASPDVAHGLPSGTDLALVLTKAYTTASLDIPLGTLTLTLQNGLNNAEVLAEKVGADHLLAGATALAVTKLSDHRVRFVADGAIRLGAWTIASPGSVADVLRLAGFTVEQVDSPALVIWEKAVANAAINPLTALLNVPNGRLAESEASRGLLSILANEAASVARAEGYPIHKDPGHAALEICRATAENISSMLQDARRGTRTEIDALSGEIARRAEKHGLHVPYTRMIWQLVRGLEPR